MKTTLEIEFEDRRCFTCGTFWAIEKSRCSRSYHCPVCAGTEIEKAVQRAQEAFRSAAAVKANVTRKLNRK